MKNTSFILLYILLTIGSTNYAQSFGGVSLESEINTGIGSEIGTKKAFIPDVSVSVGSSFTSFGNGFNAFGTFVSPELSFPVTKKFAIKTGMTYSALYFPNSGLENSISDHSLNQFGSIYVSGMYQLTEKFTVAGTAFKTFPLSGQSPQANPRALDFSNEGLIIDMNYKLSEKVSVSAGFRYQKQNSYNYYNDPSGFNSFGSPNNRSLFGPNF